MDTSKLIKENFTRDISRYEDILDDYWTVEVEGVAKADSRLARYFEHADYSNVAISIAGKAAGVNELALQVALKVLPDLYLYLKECSSKVELETENGWWNLTSIWFPYQQDNMWYLHFTSEYGADLEYCFVKKGNASEFVGVASGCRDSDSVADVLPTLKCVINELVSAKIVSQSFSEVLAAIETSETIGRELIVPLIQVVTESENLLKKYKYDHLLKLLGEIKCNSIT